MHARLRTVILGAAAGGGLPQWNCGCRNCVAAREGTVPAQTQSSIAVSANGHDWTILNASPDIRAQMQATPALHPTGLRVSPLRAVLLTNGDIDHIAGLLTLREKQPFTVFATAAIRDIVESNSVFAALDRNVVSFATVALEQPFDLVEGLTATLFAVPGKVPLFMEGEVVVTDLVGEQTVGVMIEAGGARLAYVPGCARMTPDLAERLGCVDAVLFDGTVYEDDEMIVAGLGAKTGRRMGHMPMAGEGGSLEAFRDSAVPRKVYVHINNTNPVWRPQSPERRAVEAAGWQIGHDGMEIEL